MMETHNSLGDDAESFQTMILSPMYDDISDNEEEDVDDTSVRLREKTTQILATYQDYLSDIESLENSCVLCNALHDGAPLWDSTGGNESETRHLMCCARKQETWTRWPLGIDGK